MVVAAHHEEVELLAAGGRGSRGHGRRGARGDLRVDAGELVDGGGDAEAGDVRLQQQQPALHIKRTNEGTGGEMKKMACSHTHHGRGRRSVTGDGLQPSSVARRLRRRTSMARLG